jgi:hypothetical protein
MRFSRSDIPRVPLLWALGRIPFVGDRVVRTQVTDSAGRPLEGCFFTAQGARPEPSRTPQGARLIFSAQDFDEQNPCVDDTGNKREDGSRDQPVNAAGMAEQQEASRDDERKHW